jgi:hypothetical protein
MMFEKTNLFSSPRHAVATFLIMLGLGAIRLAIKVLGKDYGCIVDVGKVATLKRIYGVG